MQHLLYIRYYFINAVLYQLHQNLSWWFSVVALKVKIP